jgi:hypothetical protein
MKKVHLSLTITMDVEVPDHWEKDTIQFHFEENYCVGNLINQLHTEQLAFDEQQICGMCSRAEVKVLNSNHH